ncbi:MAG: hypothetical protein QNJ31_09565 [Candidatus Caenarcaniphilales bacterium]|nr:hypothetical protein [Candidatus Caenarcaniphilales bacterium]
MNSSKKGATIAKAHVWYFNKPQAFSRDVIRAYEEGFSQFNEDTDFRHKSFK